MSRSKMIVAPELSGFSRLAANIGGGTCIDIMRDISEPAKFRAFDALARRIDQKPETFSGPGEIAQSMAHLVPHMNSLGLKGKAERMLAREISRGNTIPFLFSMAAKAHLDNDNPEDAIRLRESCRAAPVFSLPALAEVDAIAASAARSRGNSDLAVRFLALSVYSSPLVRQTRQVFSDFAHAGLLTPENFYPYDQELLQLTASQPLADSNAPFLDTGIFTWEWRSFLSGRFGRPLTHGGTAHKLLNRLNKLEKRPGISDRLRASLLSFQSLVFLEQNEPTRALGLSDQMLRKFENDPFILQRRIFILRDTGHSNQALACAQHLALCCPDIPCYHGILADILARQNHLTKAENAYEKLFPAGRPLKYPGFAQRYAQVLCRLGKPDKAETLLFQALHETAWRDSFLAAQQAVLFKTGNWNKLIPVLEALARDGPEIRQVHHLLAEIRAKEGALDAATEHAARAVKYNPVAPRFRLLLAELYLKSGRKDQAAEVVQPLQKRLFNHPRYKAVLAAVDE